jgi:CheY-like chemotaxis protein
MKPLALVVENDAGTRRLLDVLLTRAGYETDCVDTGADAIVLLREVEYSVIVLDLFMPARTGFDVLSVMRNEQPEMLDRVLVLTSAAKRDIDRVRGEFAVDVMRKPFEIVGVMGAIEERTIIRTTPPRAVEAFCRQSVRAGARSGIVFRLNDDHLDRVIDFGYRAGWTKQFFPIQLSDPYPICGTVRDGKPAWFATIAAAEAAYPKLLPVWTENGSQSLAAVPMIHEATVVGAVGWCFRIRKRFVEAEQSAFLRIADDLAGRLPRSEPSAGA